MKNKTILRNRVKNRFIELYAPLFDLQPVKYTHTDAKSDEGQTLVNLARKKIGYSIRTWDCDIYFTLMGFYHKINNNEYN